MKVLILVSLLLVPFLSQSSAQNYFPVQPEDIYTLNTYTWSLDGCGNPVYGNSVQTITSVQNTHSGQNYVSFFGKDYMYDSLANILYIYRQTGDKIAVDFNKINGNEVFYYNQLDSGLTFSIGVSSKYFLGRFRNIYSITYSYSYQDPTYGYPFMHTQQKYTFAEGIGEIEYYYFLNSAYAPPPWATEVHTYSIRTLLTITRDSTVFNIFDSPGLSVTVPSAGTTLLQWLDKQNFEEGFLLERKSEWDTGYVNYASFPPDSTSFTDTVSYGYQYRYRLKAYYLNFESLADTASIFAIVQPQNFRAMNDGYLKIKLLWDYFSVCDSFVVSRSSRWAAAGEWSGFNVIGSAAGGSTMYFDSLLYPGYQYRYGICAYRQGLPSPTTFSVAVYPLFLFYRPEDVTAELNEYESVNLNWREVNPYPDITYAVSRCISGYYTTIAEGLTDTMFIDETIEDNLTYTYRVRAFYGALASPFTYAEPLTIPPFIEITPPGNVLADTTGSNTVMVTWTDNSSNEKYFDIGRGSTPENIYVLDSVDFNSTAYEDTDPSSGELYYAVRGRNSHSQSNWSITIVSDAVDIIIKNYSFNLQQNYPNPFNPETIIRYSVAEYSNVQIKIFDILGSEAATLINEEKPAGQYEIHWNAAALPSGIYFYRIQAGTFTDTKKMILLK